MDENKIPENSNENIENNNVDENKIPENQNENSENSTFVDFSAGAALNTVAAQTENKNKKLPIIIIACVVVIAAVVGIVIYFTSSKKSPEVPIETTEEFWDDQKILSYFDSHFPEEEMTNEEGASISRQEYINTIKEKVQEATTSLSADVGNKSTVVIEDKTSAPVKQGTEASNKQQVTKAEAQIKAFFNRSCYFTGALYSGGTGDPMSMAFDGDNIEVLTNLDGTEVSILKIDNKMYIKRPATKQYVELTDSVLKMMGLSADDMTFDFGSATYDEMKSKLTATYDVTVDGKDGVCYLFKGSDRTFRFYSVDGELKQINIYDASGNLDSELYISAFSETIPGDQLTLKGYTESSLMTVFVDLMDTEE